MKTLNTPILTISVPETPLRAGTRNKHNNNTNNGEVKQDINAATIPRKIPYPLALIVAMIINCMPIKNIAQILRLPLL
jgi:hypothetical protein